ncbi:MAG: MFS transporter, partial [Candidatus Margulisiibacteriota bacterium]
MADLIYYPKKIAQLEISNSIQLLTNIAIFSSSLFIPVMAEELHADGFMIGLIVSIFNLSYFLAGYLFGSLSDRFGAKRILQFGLILSAIFYATQVFAKETGSLLYLRALAGFAAGIFPAALAVYAYEERKGKMGKFTAYGSLGWALGSLMAGFITYYYSIFLAAAFLFLVAFILSFRLGEAKTKGTFNLFPWRLFIKNARIYIPYLFRAIGAFAVWTMFPLYLMSTGADKFMVGIAYFVNAFTQFIMMQKAEKFRNLYLFNLGLLCTVLTFIAYALLNNFWLILPIQVLLAFAFSTLQVGAHQELMNNNREKGSVIGLLNSIANISAVIGPFVAG